MPLLSEYAPLAPSSRPVLWHTDLHMGNIFVSEEDHTKITGLIDWQLTSISPLFLQARWPVFLEPPKGYERGPELPKLPENYKQLPQDEKDLAAFTRKEAFLAKAYEVCIHRHNALAADALDVPSVFRELFIRCSEAFEESSIPLRATLIEILANWEDLHLPGKCSFTFTTEEFGAHKKEFEEYRQWHHVRGLASGALGSDSEGWIPPERDLEERQAKNKEFLDILIDKIAPEKSPEEVRLLWPYLEKQLT